MCYSPLIGLKPKCSDKDNKYSIQFVRPWNGLSSRQYRDELLKIPQVYNRYDPVDLPCGNCIACRMKKAADWTTRLTCEYLQSDNSLFLTFTYDDEHLPKSDLGFPTLSKQDIRKFNINLANFCAQKFGMFAPRHYIAGEYGSRTLRPHFHSIHYNLPPSFLQGDHLFSNRGFEYWSNDDLNRIWGKGFVVVSGFSPESAGYVARYVTKKLNGKLNEDRFLKTAVQQEFTVASNRPGIGREYYELHRDEMYAYDELILPGKGKVPIPAYYDHLLGDVDNYADELIEIKEKRRLSMDRAIKHACKANNVSYEGYLDGQRVHYESILKKLPRMGF